MGIGFGNASGNNSRNGSLRGLREWGFGWEAWRGAQRMPASGNGLGNASGRGLKEWLREGTQGVGVWEGAWRGARRMPQRMPALGNAPGNGLENISGILFLINHNREDYLSI